MDTLSLRLILAGALAMVGGCSLRYDSGDLRGEDGRSDRDSGVYDGPDAAPGALHIQAVFPFEVLEGEGYAADPKDVARVRPIPIVIAGASFNSDVVITIAGDGFEPQVMQAAISTDGRWAAFELRVPVDRTRSDGVLPLTVTAEKGGERKEWNLGRRMLPEFEKQGGVINTDELAGESFSQVDLQGSLSVTGSRPLRLVATAGISISGVMSADAPDRTPGPGGCAGGELGVSAECGPGSGKEGKSPEGLGLAAGGGGGGGFGATDAAPGVGDLGGGQGGVSGRGSLVPLPGPDRPAENRGAGGGGGGRVLGGAAPERAGSAEASAGGGSGGIIELTSPAVVKLSGLISANGAAGGICGALTLLTGGGGGGSGGAILVRAGTELVGEASLQALGGQGGGGDAAACAGGDGGVGRIRIDRPAADALQPDPEPFRGPAFAAELPAVTRVQRLPVLVSGSDRVAYRLRAIGLDPADGSETLAVVQEPVTTSNGVGEAEVTLFEGHNRLCAEADPEANLTDLDAYRESQNCLSIAYIPE